MMTIHTPLCDRLRIEVPIISAGMGPIAGPELVAAVSNAGGLGVLGCTGMTPDEVRSVIRKTRELTDRPFGADLILPARIDQGGASMSDVATLIPDEHRATAARIAEELGVQAPIRNTDGDDGDGRDGGDGGDGGDGRDGGDGGDGGERQALGTDAEAQVRAILDEGVAVFVGALGSPGFVADRFKEAGTTVVSIVGSTKQAQAVVRDGAEVVIAQGTEGGGHTGHVGTMALLPQVLDAVDVPVVAAGGVGDGRGMAAALLMGCQAVWVGTRFLATEEAGIAGWQKAGIIVAADQSPVISRAYTGKRFRMLPNDWTRAWDEADVDPLPMPLQPVLANMALGRDATDRGGREGVGMNGAGNIAGLIDEVVPAAEVVRSMTAEAAELLAGADRLVGNRPVGDRAANRRET